VYKMDPTTGNMTNVWTSSDISALIGTSLDFVRVLIPGNQQIAVSASDLIAHEIVNNGASTITIGTSQTGKANNVNTIPQNLGATRILISGNVSPATLTTGQITFNGTVPHINFGIATVPTGYMPPEPWNTTHVGDNTYNIPAFAQVAGALIDVIAVGAGGSGQSEWDAGIMRSGNPGQWASRTLVYGTDIPLGTTQLLMTAGEGGIKCGGYWQNGNNGSNSLVRVGSTVLLTALGGQGGQGGVGLANGIGQGPDPNPYVYQDKSYWGGSNVGVNHPGDFPGGGGGGATWFEFGGAGADGQVWAVARQS
jgi:hypothetical protein